jgi:ribose transport system ATP-binding protein
VAADLLAARGICRSFPGVIALDHVDFLARAGEVTALLGENGAGKSTLMRCLCGMLPIEAGEVELDGAPVSPSSPRAAHRLGIRMIHQEPSLLPNLSIAANLFLGDELRRWRLLDERAMRAAAARVLARLGADLDPRRRVATLSVAELQLVEIARALHHDVRVLFMDEPTASLTERDAAFLFGVITELCARGVAVVYVSHRLAEIERIAGHVVVLRDGKNAGELARGELTREAMVGLMVGRQLPPARRRALPAAAPPSLELLDVRTARHPQAAVSFTVGRGELVGLGGLVGAGRTELAQGLFGVVPFVAGSVRVGGQPFAPRSPAAALQAGLVLAPEDRRGQGLIADLSLLVNVALPHGRRVGRALAGEVCSRLGVKAQSLDQAVGTLSGGNQQKVVLARWLAGRPRVLVLDEPTRGIDVGARAEIHGLVGELCAQGLAVLWISSDLPELIEVADRVLVLRDGVIAGELGRGFRERDFLRLATGMESPA